MEAQKPRKSREKNPNATWGLGIRPDFIEPIRRPEDVQRIKDILKPRPRDLCLFTIGTGWNIFIIDLVRLTVGHVRGKKPGDLLEIRVEGRKTKKFMITTEIHASVLKLLRSLPADTPDDYPLFCSYRSRQSLTRIRLHKVVKKWCYLINLEGNYGAQTLRKTWFAMQRLAGVPKSTLEKLLMQDLKLEDFLGDDCIPSNLCDAQGVPGNAIKCKLKQTPQHELLPLFP